MQTGGEKGIKLRRVAQFITFPATLCVSGTLWADLVPETFPRLIFSSLETAGSPNLRYTIEVSNAGLAGGQVPFTITSPARDYVLTAVYWNDRVFPGVWKAVNQNAGDLLEPARAVNLAPRTNIQKQRFTLPDHSAVSTTGVGTSRMYAALSAAAAQTPEPFRRLGNSELINIAPDLARSGPGNDVIAEMNALVICVGAEIRVLDPQRYPMARGPPSPPAPTRPPPVRSGWAR